MPRKKRNSERNSDVWGDLDSRLDATDKLARDFFSDTHAVTVNETPFSELDQSSVVVSFDADGFATQMPDEDAEPADVLEPMPVPAKLGATEWGSDFAEIHARVEEMACVSLPRAIRYEARGAGLKVSSLPCPADFFADVCVIARRVLTPSLYRVWKEIYYEGFGKGADRVPEAVQSTIMQLCGTAWKKAGLLPFRSYWNDRIRLESIRGGTVANVVDARDTRNARRRKNTARRAEAKRAAKLQAAA